MTFLLFQRVGWWSPTIIRGDDREAVHIPNHQFSVNIVRNLTQKTHWRIKTHLAISHLDVSKINVSNKSLVYTFLHPCTFRVFWLIQCNKLLYSFSTIQNIVADMRKVLSKNPQIEQQKIHRRVFLEDIDPENQALRVRRCLLSTTNMSVLR